MKLRRTKSLILTCLIISSIVLSAYVWMSEELWPKGYNFFIEIKNHPSIRRFFSADVYSIPMENLSKPEKIVVTKGEERNVYYNSDPSFEEVNKTVSAFLESVLSDEATVQNRVTVSAEEWKNVLRNDEILDTRSLYVDFSLEYSSELFAHMIGIKNTWIDKEVSSLKEFIIAPVGEGESDVLFYAKGGGELIYKYLISYKGKSEITAAIDTYATDTATTYSYSFELNLDKNNQGIGTGVKQKVFLNSMVIMSSNSTTVPVIYGENPFESELADRGALLGHFRYAAGAPKHYTDYSGIEYFVENDAHLKLYPNGLIEYVAEADGGGIELPESPASVYEAINRSIGFAEHVWSSVVGDAPFSVLVTSDLLENDEGIYKFTLDYYYEGKLVTTEISGNGFEDMNHAVEIEVKNGKVIRYRHFFRRYQMAAEIVSTPQIEALDKIYERFNTGEDEIFINDVYLSYIENGTNSDKAPVWCAEIEGSDNIVY